MSTLLGFHRSWFWFYREYSLSQEWSRTIRTLELWSSDNLDISLDFLTYDACYL